MHSAASTVRQLRAAPNQSCFEFTLPPTANDSSLSLTTLFRSPVLDQLLAEVRRRRFDAVVCWKLDRLGRNMRHLVTLLDELRALNVGFVTIGEGMDTNDASWSDDVRDHRGGRRDQLLAEVRRR